MEDYELTRATLIDVISHDLQQLTVALVCLQFVA